MGCVSTKPDNKKGFQALNNKELIYKQVQYYSSSYKQNIGLDSIDYCYGDNFLKLEYESQLLFLKREYQSQQNLLSEITLEMPNQSQSVKQLHQNLFKTFCQNKAKFIDQLRQNGVNSYLRLSIYSLILVNQDHDDFLFTSLYQEKEDQLHDVTKNQQLENLYQKLVKRKDEPVSDQVLKDVPRTFSQSAFFIQQPPQNTSLQNDSGLKQSLSYPGREMLYNVCKALGTQFKHVGYTQGMNFPIALLLQLGNANQLQSYQIMRSLLWDEKFNLGGLFQDSFPLLGYLKHLFHGYLKAFQPSTYQVIEVSDLPDDLWLTRYVLGLFVDLVPRLYCLRLFDLIMTSDFYSLLFILVTILKVIEKPVQEQRNLMLKSEQGRLSRQGKKVDKKEILQSLKNELMIFIIKEIEKMKSYSYWHVQRKLNFEKVVIQPIIALQNNDKVKQWIIKETDKYLQTEQGGIKLPLQKFKQHLNDQLLKNKQNNSKSQSGYFVKKSTFVSVLEQDDLESQSVFSMHQEPGQYQQNELLGGPQQLEGQGAVIEHQVNMRKNQQPGLIVAHNQEELQQSEREIPFEHTENEDMVPLTQKVQPSRLKQSFQE